MRTHYRIRAVDAGLKHSLFTPTKDPAATTVPPCQFTSSALLSALTHGSCVSIGKPDAENEVLIATSFRNDENQCGFSRVSANNDSNRRIEDPFLWLSETAANSIGRIVSAFEASFTSLKGALFAEWRF
jgi:hypothetical protein